MRVRYAALAAVLATTAAFQSPAFVPRHCALATKLSTTALAVSSTTPPVVTSNSVAQPKTVDPSSIPNFPQLGEDGIYILNNPEEHAALMEYASDKLVVLKHFAPWCRACKGLEPKFQKLSQEPQYNENIPILWASLSIQHNKSFVQSLNVIALPTVQFYVGGKLLDTFPCGPSKVPILKHKLTALVQDHVDHVTGEIKPASIEEAAIAAEEAAVRVKEKAAAKEAEKQLLLATTAAATSASADSEHGDEAAPPSSTMSSEMRAALEMIPYFASMSLADLDQVLAKAVELTFEPGSILVREGKPGRTFYVIESGEVEICQNSLQFMDPMVSGAGYLGGVVNRLGPGDYFGERALITGEPRAASLRVATEPVTLWAFDKDAFPASCVLSGKSKGTQKNLTEVNDKYGVDAEDYQLQVLDKQLRESATANQVRGSVNTPEPLEIDYDSDIDVDDVVDTAFVDKYYPAVAEQPSGDDGVFASNDAIFSLLTRFQMIRHVSTCFKYIQDSRAVWGEPGVRRRRNMLVSRLTAAKRAEFKETFKLIDANNDGYIELSELKRVMDSVDETRSDDELQQVIDSSNNNGESKAAAAKSVGSLNGSRVMTFEDYMGLMAEAEFYHLFRDIFASLDKNKSGYVKARDLDRVLCGVRDLISDDRKSVIDVDDKDMLIDYEQFSRMLLGTTLI